MLKSINYFLSTSAKKRAYLKFNKLKEEISLLKNEIYDLGQENLLIKGNFENRLLGINKEDSLVTKINERYNNYYSNYLDKLSLNKKKIDLLEKAQKEINYMFPEFMEQLENILKNKKDYKFYSYLKDSLGYHRDSLPQIERKNLNIFLTLIGDEAELIVNQKPIKITDLKPSQIEFDEKKILNIIDSKIKGESKDFPYIISKDNYLLDGHHNWAADLEEDEDKLVFVYKINLPFKQLLERANKLSIVKKRDIDDKVVEIEEKELFKSLISISKAKDEKLIGEDAYNKIQEQTKEFKKVMYLGEFGIEKVCWERLVKNNK